MPHLSTIQQGRRRCLAALGIDSPGGRSEIKPSEISPLAYEEWCRKVGVEPVTMRE